MSSSQSNKRNMLDRVIEDTFNPELQAALDAFFFEEADEKQLQRSKKELLDSLDLELATATPTIDSISEGVARVRDTFGTWVHQSVASIRDMAEKSRTDTAFAMRSAMRSRRSGDGVAPSTGFDSFLWEVSSKNENKEVRLFVILSSAPSSGDRPKVRLTVDNQPVDVSDDDFEYFSDTNKVRIYAKVAETSLKTLDNCVVDSRWDSESGVLWLRLLTNP